MIRYVTMIIMFIVDPGCLKVHGKIRACNDSIGMSLPNYKINHIKISCRNCGSIYGNYKHAKTIFNQVNKMAMSVHWLYEDDYLMSISIMQNRV